MDNHTHSIAFLITLVLLFFSAMGITAYSKDLQSRYINALALDAFSDTLNISASSLPRTAFNTTTLLPVYGASEVYLARNKYQSTHFFSTYPTGFNTYEIAHGGSDFLLIAEQLAGLNNLQGKKLVISFTPNQVLTDIQKAAYMHISAQQHLYEAFYNPFNSISLREAYARQISKYPFPLNSDTFLKTALANLISSSWTAKAKYYITYPLGYTELVLLKFNDEVASLEHILKYGTLIEETSPKPVPSSIDWFPTLIEATKYQAQVASGNPYGFSNLFWRKNVKRLSGRPSSTAAKLYLKEINTSPEWKNLDLLLQVLQAKGATPIFIGRPVDVAYLHYVGVTDAMIALYFDKLEAHIGKYGYPLYDFRSLATAQSSVGLTTDISGHTSPRTWVLIDKILNDYYNGQ